MVGKDGQFDEQVPDWEMESGFDPTKVNVRQTPAWVTLGGGIPSHTIHIPSAEEVLNKDILFDINTLPLRDPDKFVSGQIHECLPNWEFILKDLTRDVVVKWLTHGVDVGDFFRPFHGNFKGKSYHSDVPPRQYYPNSTVCKQHVEFISTQLCERIATGSIILLGKVGECVPPRVIMPLTIEPRKPRLCHDERYLNLWVKDSPFHLETLRDIPRMVQENAFMITCDEKSAYDHVKLSEDSRTYFGIQFGGYFMTYATLPFGWKASPFIYQSIGICVTSYLRSLNVMNSLYIDDRFVVTKEGKSRTVDQVMTEAKKLVYAVLELLTRLGYTLSLKKCSLEPSSCKKYLGFLVDSAKQAFLLPEDKKMEFITLRELILSGSEVNLKTLQRFCGKCVSMSLAIPSCKLFCRAAAKSFCCKNSRAIRHLGALKEELEYWRFLDDWSSCSKWRPEFHKTVKMSTDSSGYRYVAVVQLGGDELVWSHYWSDIDTRPIQVKEADAILMTLMSLGDSLENSRVDILTDNMAVMGAWNNQGERSQSLNDILKAIFGYVVKNNIDLHLGFVPSGENVADSLSRKLDASETMLSDQTWLLVERKFGPHSVDLMSLDSNVMKSAKGSPLRHFTQRLTPDTSGVNVFSQDLRSESNPYVFPPFILVFPLLRFLEEQKVSCTIVVPEFKPLPVWWPKLTGCHVESIYLGSKGQKEVVKVPCKKGFVLDEVGLRWPLIAFRVSFS